MFSWMNFLIFPLVILSSVYLMELSSNLFVRRGGRNKIIPLRGSRYRELALSIPGFPRMAARRGSDYPHSLFIASTRPSSFLVALLHWIYLSDASPLFRQATIRKKKNPTITSNGEAQRLF